MLRYVEDLFFESLILFFEKKSVQTHERFEPNAMPRAMEVFLEEAQGSYGLDNVNENRGCVSASCDLYTSFHKAKKCQEFSIGLHERYGFSFLNFPLL